MLLFMRGQAVYRTIFFLPSVVPVVASSILWMWLLDPRDGIVNHGLSLVGISEQPWFKSVAEAAWPFAANGGDIFGSKDALVLMSLWGVGNFMIIYLAAIGDIPKQLYEAAELDGAGRLRQFRHITLPMLSPVIFFNLVMGLIQSVQAFTQIYVVSEGRGAPAGSTPITRTDGCRAFNASATPEMSPPPPMGTTTHSTSGRSSAISIPTVPCPAIV